VVEIWSSWKLFFSGGNKFFLFYNFNTATDGGLKKLNFRIFFLTGCLCHLLGPVSDKNYTPLETLFFSEGNQKNLFYNFKSATDGGLKNVIFEKKI
jgi:hypothetical protein